MNHGTRGLYGSGCRCQPCTEANRTYAREYVRRRARAIREMMQPISEAPADHGTWSNYGKGCRCTRCREAQREENANRQRPTRLPVHQPVPLAPLLERLISHLGKPVNQFERYEVARACGVSERTVNRWYNTQQIKADYCDAIAIKLGWHPAAIWGADWYIQTYDREGAA